MSNLDEDDDFFADIYGDDDVKKETKEASTDAEATQSAPATTKSEPEEKPSDPRLGGNDNGVDESKSAPAVVQAPDNTANAAAAAMAAAMPQVLQGMPQMPPGMPQITPEQAAAAAAAGVVPPQPLQGGITTGNIYIPPKDEGKMFIGGLNWETTDESLRNYFGQYGEVLDCTVMRDNNTGRSRGFGFLTFKDAACVTEVLKKEHFLDGKIIDPKRAIPREEQDKTAKIFVGGVGSDVNEDDFKTFFDQYGTVIDAQLMMDKDTGRPRGFGFVTFDSDHAVEKIVSEKFLILKNKPIEVKRAEPRSKNGVVEQPQQKAAAQMGGQQAGGYNMSMNPQMMAQYMQQWQAYMAQMQQMMAMNPQGGQQMMSNPMMQQYQQMMQQQQQQQQQQQSQEEGHQDDYNYDGDNGKSNNEDQDPSPYSAQEEGDDNSAAHDDRNVNAYRERFRNRYNRRDRDGSGSEDGHERRGGGNRNNRRSRSPPANAPTGPRSRKGRNGGGRGGRYHPYHR